ncbi:MAG: archease [Desulfuromonadales bacterium]
MGRHRLLEHTADMGIEIEGDDLADFFLQAAQGLMAVVAGREKPEIRQMRRIEIEGEDLGELLVNWLNEVLFLLEIKGFFPAVFHIEEVGARRLKARLEGEPFDPQRHRLEREVKAVTYHQLRVEEQNGRWRARVFVDL